MSCIAGIVNLDGQPVDKDLLERMTAAMRCRAPDATGTWLSGNVGIGHAMLRISPESVHEKQPCTLGVGTWITADARIDGRAGLLEKLRNAGRQVEHDAPDPELILHAYHAFGDSFLEHLVGDFAFALWDERQQKLVCARDHFGLRPFYYVKTAHLLLFASDIAALQVHPVVSRELDGYYVADFLMIGCATEPETSVYRDIRRLPPASVLTLDGFKRSHIRRYWELTVHQTVRSRSDDEYVHEFQSLFDQAVGDRSRGNRVAVEMSGGLDSTAVAASAVATGQGTGRLVTAHTVTCREFSKNDREGYFAGLVASHLDIPVFYQQIENYGLFEGYESREIRTDEPISNPNLLAHHEKLKLMANSGTRVMLTGQGGDAVFAGSGSYHRNLLYSGKLIRLTAEIYRHWKFAGSLRGMGLRSALIPGFSTQETWQPAFPEWISPDFVARTQMRDRWNFLWQEWNKPSDAIRQLKYPWISQVLASYEALEIPVVARHPFYDVRLVEFVLGLPNYLTRDKAVLRMAMDQRLPDAVRNRPKTTVGSDTLRAKLISREGQSRMRSGINNMDEKFVDKKRFDEAFAHYLENPDEESNWPSVIIITPVALSTWLNYH